MDNTINQSDRREKQPPGVTIYDSPETKAEDTTTTADQSLARQTETSLNASYYNETQADKTPEELEQSIEQTQERIAENVDELAKRLNPARMKDQAVQSLNDSLNLKGL
jgi:uncharacterized protein with von Willebrand factor type A (vWA) domain